MVNYKIVNTCDWIEMESWTQPGIMSGYVESGGDVLEVKTNQTVAQRLPMRKAKELCRHLNFGGGFDGFTPAFFLQRIEKNDQTIEEFV